ncbi:helix-turn-helix transcriptional regulator [Sphingomonas panni]
MTARIESADRLVPLAEVKAVAGLGKSMIYRLMRAGNFPRACKAGGNATRWSVREVEAWVAARLAGRREA